MSWTDIEAPNKVVSSQFSISLNGRSILPTWASQVALLLKNCLPMQETKENQVRSLLRRFPGEVHSNPLQYSCPENPMDREAWQAAVHRVAKTWTWPKWLSTLFQLFTANSLNSSLSHPTSSPSANYFGSTLALYPQPDHFSLPPLVLLNKFNIPIFFTWTVPTVS